MYGICDVGVLDAGWGSLESKTLADAEGTIEKHVQVRRLDEFGISKVDFIKIDVEGHELEVLKGGAATIEASRPILLIEIEDDNLPRVSSWLESHGFKQVSIEHIFQLKERNSN